MSNSGWEQRAFDGSLRCHAWRAFLLVSTLLAVDGIGFADDGAVVLLRHGDREVTVRDATGVGYHDAIARIRDIVRRHGQPKDVMKGFPGPATRPYDPEGDVDLVGWYHHLLSGVVQKYVEACVYDQFVEQYPDAATQSGIRFDDVDEYVAEWARRDSAIGQAVWDWLHVGRPLADVEGDFRKRVPTAEFDAVFQRMFQSAKQSWLVVTACLPRVVDGKPTPWMTWDVKSDLMRRLVETEIARDIDEYVEFVRRRGEVRPYFVVEEAPEDDEALKELLSELMDENGTVALSGVRAASATLQSLGRKTRIGVREFEQNRLAREYGIDHRLESGEIFRDDSTVVVTFAERGRTRPVKRNPLRGGGLYSDVSTHLQMPLIERCRTDLEVADFVTLSDNAEIDDSLGGSVLRTSFLGSPLPTLVDPVERDDE